MKYKFEFMKQLFEASAFFDKNWYLDNYPDVAEAGANPVEHYIQHGAREGRNPGPHFDTRTYLDCRPDVAAAGLNPLLHFLQYGIIEVAALPPAAIVVELERRGISFGDELPQANAVSAPVAGPAVHYAAKTGPIAVFVSHDASLTGAPAVLEVIARWFQNHTDYDVRIICLEDGPRFEAFRQIAPVLRLDKSDWDEDTTDNKRAKVREFVGAAPAFTFINSIASGKYCQIDPYDSPRLAFVHELEKVADRFPLEELLLRERVDHVLCDGEPVAEFLRARGFADDRLSVRSCFIDHNGLTAPLRASEKARLKASMGWPSDAKIVMGCGTVHWRKQPQTFVRMATAITGDVRFIWIGDGEDLEAIRELIKMAGVADRVEFIGTRSDFRELLQLADVFALTSSEDPFPLVCLEAALAFVPSVIFREAGGIHAMVVPEGLPPAGRAVTLGDEAAFFAAVQALLDDDAVRQSCGHVARERVEALYTTDRACMEILLTLRRVAGIPPRVSVLVPTYNSAKYLEPRLSSIANQTFKDVEIVLRDDASKDETVPMLEAFAREHPLARVLRAETNSGSVFRAWSEVIKTATGDLLWIAEADDVCEPDFLAKIVPTFAASGIRLAHGRSIPMNAQGEIVGDYATAYLDSIAPGRWKASFDIPARLEVNAALGRGNCIPNASGVVVRRGSARRAAAVAVDFRLAGDWAFYLAAIHGGRIAYVHEAVNYHRRHDETVTHRIEGTHLYFQELADTNALTRHLYGPDEARDAAFAQRLAGEAARFGWSEPLPAGRVPESAARPRPPGVLYGVGDLSGGGAQMFAARFVSGWLEKGSPAVLFTTGHQPAHEAVLSAIAPDVPVLSAAEIEARGLPAIMRDYNLERVVTGHWWADRWMARTMDALADSERPPWTVIMHGCHENVLDNLEEFDDHQEVFTAAERHVALWVWTAAKNKRVFSQGYVTPRATVNITNGFTAVSTRPLARQSLGIPDDAVVFTLASRAIASKGWLVAMEAFAWLRQHVPNSDRAHLLLIGDGPVASEIDAMPLPDGVHRVAHTSRLADYIALSDVGLLPSWFPGESMPLVLIEFLAQGKPVIASDIGNCPWVLSSGEGKQIAGIVVERNAEGVVTAESLAAAMRLFLDDELASRQMARAATEAFAKFSFDAMIDSYVGAIDAAVMSGRSMRAELG
ncbi:glycosyltransferase [Ancylobacter sp. SL191]|uniref:glycosyltransferase n=1 Tax=Ancylobacter sp. SL191 TaxID=2995166 RepID=UPI002270DD0A|nr:glycosyltransferase [Ancylobacter sp. SL191]WAC28118.1 glycosyltransferase [Ancylobacter sp. SL191]